MGGFGSPAGETEAPTSGWGVSRGYPAPPPRPRPQAAGSAPPAAAASRGRAARGKPLRRGWGKLPRRVAFLRCRWLDRFNKSLFSRSLALLRGTGGGVSPQPPSEKATHTQRTKAVVRGLPSSSPSGRREEGALVRAGRLSRASPPDPPHSRPGSSEGISGLPARPGGPGAMLSGGLGNA